MRFTIALLFAGLAFAQSNKQQVMILTGEDAPNAPTDSPGGGTYGSAQSVTLSDPTASLILYTIDGSTPACPATGTLYTGAISISVTTTLKAIGCNGVTGGGVLTSVYTITAGGSWGAVTKTVSAACTPNIASCSLTATTTAGDTLIMCAVAYRTGTPAQTLSSATGDTFTHPTGVYNTVNASDPQYFDCVYRLSATGVTSGTFTWTWTGGNISNGMRVWLFESKWSGSSVAFDNTNNASDSACTSCAAPSLTISGTNDFVVQIGNPLDAMSAISGGYTGDFSSGWGAAYLTGVASYSAPSWTQGASMAASVGVIALKGQ